MQQQLVAHTRILIHKKGGEREMPVAGLQMLITVVQSLSLALEAAFPLLSPIISLVTLV